MPESREGHALRKELFEDSYSRKLFFNRKEIQSVGLGVCHPKEINLYKKWQQHRESCSQAVHYIVGGPSGHIKRLKSGSIQSFMPSRTVSPRFSTTDSSNLLGIFIPIRSRESYSVNAFSMYSLTDSDKPYSISCARSLSFHDSYTIKTPQPNTTYKLVSQASIINNSFLDLHLDQNFHQAPISYRGNKRRYAFKQQRPQKKKLHRIQNSNSDFIIQNPYEKVRLTHTRRLAASETNRTPYAKTVAVYTVFNQKPTKREPRNTLGSNASFNMKFYRSMGDGRQMYGNNAPYVPIPRNYSPTNMARMGRDEDGCICMYIPQQPDYERFRMGNYEGGGFLKRYFRILLKEQKRCLCGKARSKPKPYSYATANYIPPIHTDDECRYNNASNNFRGNDVSCQCKCKERREQRPDRDIFCKDRGVTCCVPKCPGVQSNSSNPNSTNTANVPNAQTKGMPDKDAVNIGSNFSFQVGVYKRCLDNRPPPFSNPNPNNYYSYNNNMPAYDPEIPYMQNVQPCIDDCGFSCSDAPSYREPKSSSVFSVMLRSREPKFEVKSSGMQSAGLGGENDYCSRCNSNEKGLKSPSSSWSQFIKSQFERNDICCNNQPMSYCKPKKNKAVRCRCDKKPKLIGCTDQQNSVGIICSRSTSGQSASTQRKSNNVKNSGCNCINVPEGILAPCTKKKKICCQCDLFGSKKSRKRSRKCGSKKSCECCSKECSKCCGEESNKCSKKSRNCSCKCKIPKKKQCVCKKEPKFFKIIRTMSTLLQEANEGGCCRCKTSDNKNKYDKSCCCNKTSQTTFSSIVRPISMLLQKIGNRCNLAKKSTCKCSNNSGEFDYKKVLDSIKMSEQTKAQRCLCGDSTMKKIFSSQLVPPEPTQLTKAQQCGCIDNSNMKKKFGRLLLYNTVQPKPICCSGVTYDQNSRSIGTGEDDYRRVPPCRRARVPDGSQGDGFALKKLVSKLINPEKCSTRMHYTAFNPQNQSEAGVQHIGRVGPDERAGRETVCRNQGVECPRSKPLTMKDCENAANACPASQQDSDRRAVRLGSSCSFCFEFYKGAPPPKNLPTRSAPPALPPKSAPYADTPTNSAIPGGDNICCPTKTPCPAREPIIKKALTYFLLTQKKHLKSNATCQKCNKCVKVPLVKQGFSHLILKDKKPETNLNARTCQRTNTLQPNRKLIVRKPAAGGKGGLGNSRNCDPYVCLKRINQRKCCNAK